MEIKLNEITVREIAQGFVDNSEEGVVAYDGKLNVRPKYQREFVYDKHKRDAVIETINKGFPLNVMYWVKNSDDSYEVLDGQQRTISFCQYVQGFFSLDHRSFHNLTKEEQDKILDYKLMVYFCSGTDKEKLDWFRIINIAGEKLTEQELRNATYTGTWLTHAKSIFSKNNCAAYGLSSNYVSGSPIRQELLERALSWINKGQIEDYMSIHQHDETAEELWEYYQNVINWVTDTFVVYRKEMKGVDWGNLYDEFHTTKLDTSELEEKVKMLMQDDDITNKKGIYPYALNGKEKYLNIRVFTDNQKRKKYEEQGGNCPHCKKKFKISEMEGDHINPWCEGGKTDLNNLQMLCKECNRKKGSK